MSLSTSIQSLSPSLSLQIHIKNLGHILSFKNRKRIGKKRLFLDPKYKIRMDAITRAIESQLRGLYLTGESGIPMGCSLQSWIASNMPLNDSLEWMAEGEQKVKYVEKGEEGCLIQITKIK